MIIEKVDINYCIHTLFKGDAYEPDVFYGT